MSQPADERTPQQVANERAMEHVSDVLLNLEQTLDHARRGHKIVARDGANINAELALVELIKDLDRLRKRFTQDTYYATDERLI
jgi:hypothetical protein